jgi:lysophospholipase L1-like esterase
MKKAVALGDSITWGFPYGEEASWVHILEKNFTEIQWINRGNNGDTFEWMYRRLKADVLDEKPDICIVTAGINDAFSDYSLPEIRDYVIRIFQALNEQDIRGILGIPVSVEATDGFSRKVGRIQEMLKSLGQERDWPILDFRVLGAGDYFDEVHPNRKGYEKMGETAIRFFEGFKI